MAVVLTETSGCSNCLSKDISQLLQDTLRLKVIFTSEMLISFTSQRLILK